MEKILFNKMTYCGVVVFSTMLPLMAIASTTTADTGLYIGGKTGWVSAHNACESHNLSCDNDELGGGVFMGYTLNNWLAIEGGYNYLGKIKAVYPALGDASVKARYRAEVQAIELGLKPYYALNDNIQLYAKVGTMAWQADVKGHEIGYQYSTDDQGFSPMLGAGLAYRINDNISLQTEYQWVNNVGGDDSGGSNINFLTLGLAYHFGHSEKAQPVAVEAVQESTHRPVTLTTDNIYFTFGSTHFSGNATETLSSVISYLQQSPQNHIIIQGHTDSIGSMHSNQRLSERRAEAVGNYLQQNGINASQIVYEGKGETQPIADNSTSEGRAKNRRVLFINDDVK